MEIKEKMNILIAYGTRPEYIKLKPILNKIGSSVDYKLLYTGQHVNLVPEIFPDCKIEIKDGSNRLDSIVQSILNCDDKIFEGITHVMVLGDTTTTLAVSLASFHRKIPVIHIEAGARTYDKYNPYPEEVNRQLISKIASIHFCPTEIDKENLENEMCGGDFYVVGQSVLDNLKHIIPIYGNKILITLHRRENHIHIPAYFKKLSQLAEIYTELEFILPIHPTPDIYKHKNLLKNINVVDFLEHERLIDILSTCKFVITDSGGIMDEACFLQKKVIVPRISIENEKHEMIGKSFLLCANPEHLHKLFEYVYDNYVNIIKCPFGDGNTSSKILKVLKKERDYE